MFLLYTLCAWTQPIKDSSSLTLLSVGSGVDFTGVRSGNFGQLQPSLSITIGKQLGHHFYLFGGIDFSNYRFSSDPFLKSHTTYTQGAFVTTIDTFHTVRHNRTKYIGVPIKLMYHNQQKTVSSYFSIGMNPCYNHWDLEYDQELIHPSQVSRVKMDQGKGSGLFATAEAGISLNKSNWGLNLGISSNYIIFRSSQLQEKLYSVGLDLGVTKKIKSRKGSTTPAAQRTAGKTMNAFYLELMGAGKIYSLNYERALVKTKLFEVHFRAGASFTYLKHEKPDSAMLYNSTVLFPDSLNLFYYGNRFLLPHYLPLSFAASFGEINKFEFGMGISYNPKGSPGEDSFIFGEFGFRREDENNVLFRLTFTPLINMTTDEILPYIGVSLGKRF